MDRIKCMIGKHDFSRVIAQGLEIEIRECWICGQHLNTHHGLQQAFVSPPKSSLYEELKQQAEMELFKGRVSIYPLKKDMAATGVGE